MPTTTELEAILTQAGAVLSPSEEEALREAVCRFAGEARAEGMPPETVIQAIRSVVKAAGNKTSDDVIQRVIEWCMQEFFRDQA